MTAGPVAAFRQAARRSGSLWAAALAVDRLSAIGVQRLWRPRRVSAASLSDQLTRTLRAWGMADDDVEQTVSSILYADLRGIDSHGCCMLPFYQRLLRGGVLDMRPAIRVVHEGPSTALVDGGGGLGHVPARFAMARAIELARGSGVGLVAVTNSGHFGAAGIYAAQAAAADFIGMVTSTTPTPAVVPTFGRAARLGTNPLAFAAPARRHPAFLLDMATSTASLGKLVERWRAGRRIPAGWAVDGRGQAIRNGHVAAAARRLTPLGGDYDHGSHKGYGLAVLAEILSATLPALNLSRGADGRRAHVGHCCLAIDPRRFDPSGGFGSRMDALIEHLHATPPLEPDRPVEVAGDRERRILAERTAHGIPLAHAVLEDLREVADTSGVPFVLDVG